MNESPRMQVEYRMPIVISVAGMFIACTVWLMFGPDTFGFIGMVLSHENGLSWVSLIATAISLFFALNFLIFALRAILGKAAVDFDGEKIHVFVFPFKTYYVRDVDHIHVSENHLVLTGTFGERRVSLMLLKNWDAFVERVEHTAAST